MFSRRFFQGETTGHWAVEVGDYIWELENRNGVVDYHIGVWTNPGDVDGRPLVATEREEIGYTLLSDIEIREAGNDPLSVKAISLLENPLSWLTLGSGSGQEWHEPSASSMGGHYCAVQNSLNPLEAFVCREAV